MENEKVKQIRMNALVAEFVYANKIKWLARFNLLINILTIILPIIITAALLVIKGTSYEGIGNIISILLSAVLLGLVILSLLMKTEDRKISYHICKKDNKYVANEALKLIKETDDKLSWFYTYIAEIDARDSDFLSSITDNLSKKAYRNALMKLIPGSTSVVCPVCHASPFTFDKGLCQVCGNTPGKTTM